MNQPEWFSDPLPKIKGGSRIRKIFHLLTFKNPHQCLQEIKRCGGRPIRVLPHLKVVIGEFDQDDGLYSLEGHPDVSFWERDIQVTITDPIAGKVSKSLPSLPWGVQRVGAHKIWKYTQGRGVRVAVIDTGIANDHPSIRKNYKGGINILSPMFSPYDYNGHGTHVAGTIAGRHESLGGTGVAPRAYLYAVKAFNRRGSANLSDLLSAINWCIENRMQVVNMSFGMNKISDTLRQAIQTAYRKGIVMVAASGNQGTNGDIDYPARYRETLGVTATSRDGKLASFSNTGAGVDLAAPGDKILSAWLNGTTREMSGTSMAVPHVTGTVALLLFLHSGLTPDQLRHLLVQSTDSVSGESGLPSLDAHRSAQMLARYMGRFIP